jgi:hypothetical protein
MEPKIKLQKEMQIRYWDKGECYLKAKELKLKHLFKVGGQIFNVDDDPIRSVNFTLITQLFRRAGKINLIKKYQIYERMHDQKELKNLGDYMKTLGPRADKHWNLLVNIETLWGWREIPNDEKIAEKVRHWVEDEFIPNYSGDSEQFNLRFRDKVRQILRWRDRKLKNPISIDDFVQNIPLAGTGGSAYDPGGKGKDITFEVEGIKVKPSRRNKYTRLLGMTGQQKIDMIKNNTEHKCNVSIKMEIYPKVRTIVSLALPLAEQQRYVDQWLKKWMDGNPISTLWSRSSDKLDMWVKMSTVNGVKVPIDQSAFDEHVSKTMIKIINEEILSLIQDMAEDNNDLVLVMEKIIIAMQSGEIIHKQADGKINSFKYKNGVLSGWQWTAFYDTVCNIAEGLLARDLCDDRGIHVNVYQENYQGDDQLMVVENYRQAMAYWAAMASMGLEINFSKNFFSEQHNEYLRKWATSEEVNGYPARIINSMTWLYPGQEFVDGHARLVSIVNNWMKLAQRMQIDYSKIEYLAKRDIIGAKIREEDYLIWRSIPKTRGGLGLDEIVGDKMVSAMPVGDKINIQIDAAGLKEFELRYGEYQDRELKNWVVSVSNVKKKIDSITGNDSITTITPAPQINEIKFLIQKGLEPILKPEPEDGFTTEVIFSTGKELMEKLFPNVDKIIEQSNAPRGWIYEWLIGQANYTVPSIEGWSDEASALAASDFLNSLDYAMFNKRNTHRKWESINFYFERQFPATYSRHFIDTYRRELFPIRG